jgi:hypothetical protein
MAPLSRNQLEDLVLGVLNLVRSEGGFATKTKLLKILYLSDIEAYRDTRSTLTGFDWIFHLYGPWTPEFDELLDGMTSKGLIEVQPGNRRDLDTQFIVALGGGSLDKLSIPVLTWASIGRLARFWANEPTGEILNYVYFHTEPMRDAKGGERIDFSTVAAREGAPLYRRAESSADKKQLRSARREFREALQLRKNPSQAFTPPTYDETFCQGIEAFDDQSD